MTEGDYNSGKYKSNYALTIWSQMTKGDITLVNGCHD